MNGHFLSFFAGELSTLVLFVCFGYRFYIEFVDSQYLIVLGNELHLKVLFLFDVWYSVLHIVCILSVYEESYLLVVGCFVVEDSWVCLFF